MLNNNSLFALNKIFLKLFDILQKWYIPQYTMSFLQKFLIVKLNIKLVFKHEQWYIKVCVPY